MVKNSSLLLFFCRRLSLITINHSSFPFPSLYSLLSVDMITCERSFANKSPIRSEQKVIFKSFSNCVLKTQLSHKTPSPSFSSQTQLVFIILHNTPTLHIHTYYFTKQFRYVVVFVQKFFLAIHH